MPAPIPKQHTQSRVLIASLFLPVTIAFAPDSPPISPPTSPSPVAEAPPVRLPLKIRSIVDDISFRSTSPLNSPISEPPNPFTSFSTLGIAPRRPQLETRQSSNDARLPPQTVAKRLSRKSSRLSSGRRSIQGDDLDYSFVPNPKSNVGLFNAVNSVKDIFTRGKAWFGVVGECSEEFSAKTRTEIDTTLREEHECFPVWPDDATFTGAYDVFCHQVLWPTLHSVIPDAPKSTVFSETTAYAHYAKLNELIADAIVAAYQPGDVIWVNDYHLMLVPKLVRAKIPKATIGFFMHVAFPSSEIFRCLAVRENLLRGILGADLTHNHTRHFRQTVSRILSLEAVPKGIHLEHSFVDVAVFPIGIDVVALEKKRKDPEVLEWVQLLRQRYGDVYMIVGRDKLDEIQGVRQKVLAFEAFLELNPEYQGQAVLVQIALSTTGQNEMQVQGSVTDVVARINSRFSTLTYQPIVFLHTQDLTFSQYLALLTVADAFIVTSLREGMALRTHEFVECQDERKRPLILSEFTGSYSYSGFRSCLAINPWDTRMTAEAIRKSLEMDDEEAATRWQDLHRHVITQTAQAFATSFLARCAKAHMEHEQRDPHAIPLLDVSRVKNLYESGNKRLILIDLERTLWPLDPKSSPKKPFNPPKEALQILRQLADDPRNEVWALSGMPIRGRLELIAADIPNIGVCAENGCFLKWPAKSDWTSMVSAGFNLTWKAPCLEILSYFTERTPGSFIDERQVSVVWRFWTGSSDDPADKQWARRQAAEAQNHIWDSLGERFNLRIIPGATSFLVLPNNVSRTAAVAAVLQDPSRSIDTEVSQGTSTPHPYDFIFALSGDESLLSWIDEIPESQTCSTSMKSSDAMWRLDQKAVLDTMSDILNSNK